MKRKALGLGFILIAALMFGSIPAFANHISSAKVSDSCTGYDITVAAANLVVGHSYQIIWQINGLPDRARSVNFHCDHYYLFENSNQDVGVIRNHAEGFVHSFRYRNPGGL